MDLRGDQVDSRAQIIQSGTFPAGTSNDRRIAPNGGSRSR
jgi:hypothetical protein